MHHEYAKVERYFSKKVLTFAKIVSALGSLSVKNRECSAIARMKKVCFKSVK